MKPEFNFIIEHTLEEGENILTFIPSKRSEGYSPMRIPVTQEQWNDLQYHFMKAIDDKNQVTRLSYLP